MKKFDFNLYQNEGNRGCAEKPMGFTNEYQIERGNTELLAKAVQYDNCPARYKGGYKKGDNFIEANCILADIDNTHSDNAENWITHDDVKKALPNVEFYCYPSRNNMKQKGNKAPRPKEHFIFPIENTDNVTEYCETMKWLINTFPHLHFDKAVKGPAQLNFGVENPVVKYVQGKINLSELMKNYMDFQFTENSNIEEKIITKERLEMKNIINENKNSEIIPEGTRNETLHKFAIKVLANSEDTTEAYEKYLAKSKCCVPLLEKKELSSIWNSAYTYYVNVIKPQKEHPDPSNCISDFSEWVIQPKNPVAVQQLYSIEKKNRKFSIAIAKLILKAIDISIRLNDMNGVVEVGGLPEKYTHDDAYNILATLVEDIANTMNFKRATEKVVHNYLTVIANENHYHPVIELITKEKWDKKDRLENIYQVLNLKDELNKSLIRKWALQTIALLFNSETKPISAEGVLVLQGKQGIGKTQFFRHLALNDKFFKGGATIDMGNKDCLISATRVWICELGEIDSTTKKEQSALKAFLTESTDRFRAPYARCESVKIRRTSFCGTVNPKEYLRDETGNRRYWTIPVEKIEIKKIFEYSTEWYLQFWRQIFEEYNSNPKGYLLTADELEKLNKRNSSFESLCFGEDEFLSCFNIQSDQKDWKLLSASDIANHLNEEYKQLRITSSQIGKLINKIEQKMGISFIRKIRNGRHLILCPPFKKLKGITDTPNHGQKELPDYKPKKCNINSTINEEITF